MSLLLAAGGAPSGTTGAISTTLAGASASVTGVETFSGAISTTLTGATASVAGSETFSGSISTTLAGATAALTGAVSGAGTSGSIATTLAGATASLTGSETYSGSISSLLDGASAILTGSVSGGAISGVIATTLDGASASLVGSGGVNAAGGYDEPKKKRFIVEKDGKLLVYSTAQGAIDSLDEPEKPAKPNIPAKKAKKVKAISIDLPPDEPQEVIDLGAVQEYARIAGLIEQYNAAYNSARYEALIALFEQMRDEEEVEMLLMGVL